MFENQQPFKNPFLRTRQPRESTRQGKQLFLFERVTLGRKEPRRKTGVWNDENHLKYLACVYCFKDELRGRVGRDLWQVYKQLALCVKDRNANQCRIYHKKMIAQHETVEGILTHYSDLIQAHPFAFQQHLERASKAINHCSLELDKNREQKSTTEGSSRILPPLSLSLYPPCQLLPQSDKKQDIFPTDVGYPEQSACASKPVINKIDYLEYYPAIKQMSESYFESILSVPQEHSKRERDWLECHQLFLAWTSKFKSLMES